MLKRYAESFGDTVYVIAESNGDGLYITDTTGQIIIARNVKLDDNGNIKYWGRGLYYAIRKYTKQSDYLASLSQAIADFEG